MIRHAAMFRLKHPPGSPAETDFLAAVRALSPIPGVEKFELARQVSGKNDFHFVVSMEFANEGAYQGYNSHPDHVAFVQNRWVPEAADFMEVDTVALSD